MTRSSQTLIAVAVAVGLALPTAAEAQRHGSGGGGGGGGSAVSRPSGSTGGGGGVSGVRSAPSGGSATTVSSPTAAPRNRNGQPITGAASARMLGTVSGLPGPVFGPWGFFPFYNAGFGYGFGYDPFFYGGFGYGPYSLYGPWNDPFFYDPLNPFGYGYTQFNYGYGAYGGYAGPDTSSSSTTHVTGSVRLKVSPDTAKVYVDGVLAGTAKEFGGLFSNHLVLEAGAHQLELRADGYQTYQETLTVAAGKTQTERISLQKNDK